jgi:hypothetical protein
MAAALAVEAFNFQALIDPPLIQLKVAKEGCFNCRSWELESAFSRPFLNANRMLQLQGFFILYHLGWGRGSAKKVPTC